MHQLNYKSINSKTFSFALGLFILQSLLVSMFDIGPKWNIQLLQVTWCQHF